MPKRELIEPRKGDKRYVRRDDSGGIQEVDDVGSPSAADQRRDRHREALAMAEVGQWDKGNKGDRES